MAALSLFLDVPLGREAHELRDAYLADECPDKVFLDDQACLAESGRAWSSPAVLRALRQLAGDPTLDHEEPPGEGVAAFTGAAAELVLGRRSGALLQNRAAGVQTVGGTGALWLGARFLRRWYPAGQLAPARVYLAWPRWDHYRRVFADAGFTDLRPYSWWDDAARAASPRGLLRLLRDAPERCIVLLHAPEESGLAPEQWEEVAAAMERKRAFPFFDVSAQGLASGDLDRDAWALRLFVARGFELFCAQSFSKIFGLYDHRVGNLIAVTADAEALLGVRSQLRRLAAAAWAGPPGLGARAVAAVLSGPALRSAWERSLRLLARRIVRVRRELKRWLRVLGTPGSWEHITAQAGTRSFSGLLPAQVAFLAEHEHVYLGAGGQLSLCSLNARNLERVARSIRAAVLAPGLDAPAAGPPAPLQ
ncbi:putative aspartate aminotransferase, cytoplasmic 2 [Rhea pennata]|uniref:putative aspartate aminotransferase, cytoplasmic 2 n=1 Tax=Rhea pennata TaxID=8795 RepID=UPI002E2770F5